MLTPSPLNYTGGKFKLLPQILPHFPQKIDTFVDLFCGGCSVGINVPAERVFFIDRNPQLMHLYSTFRALGIESVFRRAEAIIESFTLSRTDLNGYAHYDCESSGGLGTFNRDGFLRLREAYNTAPNLPKPYIRKVRTKERLDAGFSQTAFTEVLYPPLEEACYTADKDAPDYMLLYILIVFAFNNQIRFNRNGHFNLPVGKRDFNGRMQEKLRTFLTRLEQGEFRFFTGDFRVFDPQQLTKDSLVYCDPPYLITCATYNEQGGWSESDERDLLDYLDELNHHGLRFALSNVLRSQDSENTLLINWAKKYRTIPLTHSYKNSNYQRKDKSSAAEEVLILNY